MKVSSQLILATTMLRVQKLEERVVAAHYVMHVCIYIMAGGSLFYVIVPVASGQQWRRPPLDSRGGISVVGV